MRHRFVVTVIELLILSLGVFNSSVFAQSPGPGMSELGISVFGIRGPDGVTTRELYPGMVASLIGRFPMPPATKDAARETTAGFEFSVLVGADMVPAKMLSRGPFSIGFQVPFGIRVAEPGKYLQEQVWLAVKRGDVIYEPFPLQGSWFMVPPKPLPLQDANTEKVRAVNQTVGPNGLQWSFTSPASPAVGQDGKFAIVVLFAGIPPADENGKLLAGADIRVQLDAKSVPSGTLFGAFAIQAFPGIGQLNLDFATGQIPGRHEINVQIDGDQWVPVEVFFP